MPAPDDASAVEKADDAPGFVRRSVAPELARKNRRVAMVLAVTAAGFYLGFMLLYL